MEIGNKNVVENLKLIFHLDYSSLTYSIFNTNGNCFEKIKAHNFNATKHSIIDNIQHIINQDSQLSKKYNGCLGTVDIGAGTFIPESLFEKSDINHYLNFTSKIDPNNTCLYTKQNFSNCYSIFQINKRLYEILKQKFNSVKLKHSSSLLVDYFLHVSKGNNPQLFTTITNNSFHIMLIQNQKFIFYNKFEFSTDDEFLYHFLNSIKVLELNTKKTPLYINSNLEKDHVLFKRLTRHISHFEFMKRPTKFLYNNEIMEIADQKNHYLFGQLICE